MLTVSGGILRFNVATGSAAVGAGVTATVSNSATLELAGMVSALSFGPNRVNVTNSSNGAAGILVSGIHQQVGGIDGNGTTQVNAGSDLTADHIIQTALIIGGASGSPALVTIDASDASGNPLNQTNELTGLVTPSGLFGAGGISSTGLSGGGSELVALSAINSVVGGNLSSVPEPSTLLLVLLAITILAGQRIGMRRLARCNDL